MAQARTLLHQTEGYVGHDPDSEYVALSFLQLVLILPRQVLNDESDITGGDNVLQAASSFVKTMEGLDLKHRIFLLETLDGSFIMRTFLLHILYHL